MNERSATTPPADAEGRPETTFSHSCARAPSPARRCETPVELAVSDVYRYDRRRPTLKKTIRESTGGCPRVEPGPSGDGDVKPVERAASFSPPRETNGRAFR